METRTKATIAVSSTAFSEGNAIPKQYTCDGENISPPLAWGKAPEGAKSFALIVDDPDAPTGTFTHWVIFNLPGNLSNLPESVPTTNRLANGARQGINSFGKTGYGGPCPPSGTHRYFFKLYALDAVLGLDDRAKKPDLLRAMEGHVLGEGQLMGRYSRK